MLVFQFGAQSACADYQFNLVDTLQILRSSNYVEEAAKPYFKASKFWELIAKRSQAKNFQVDQLLHTNLLTLGGVIAEANTFDSDSASVNLQALNELQQWVLLCDAHPQRWDQYCSWPGRLRSEFLDLLANNNDIAMLLVIYWSAVLHRSPKPSVSSWAKRAVQYAMKRLSEKEKWENLLVWPLHVLREDKTVQPQTLNLASHMKMLNMSKRMKESDRGKNAHCNEPVAASTDDLVLGAMTLNSLHNLMAIGISISDLTILGSADQSIPTGTGNAFDPTWPPSTSDLACISSSTTLLDDANVLLDQPVFTLNGSEHGYNEVWPASGLGQSVCMDIDLDSISVENNFV
jgi:hypothetical protein